MTQYNKTPPHLIPDTKFLSFYIYDLVEYAIESAEVARDTHGFSLDKTQWVVSSHDTRRCCLAGSVLVRNFPSEPENAMAKARDDARVYSRLKVLDYVVHNFYTMAHGAFKRECLPAHVLQSNSVSASFNNEANAREDDFSSREFKKLIDLREVREAQLLFKKHNI